MSEDGQPPEQQAWWLEVGPETCSFCEVRYHYEIAVYCAGCDQPTCPYCIVFVERTREPACPQCATALEKGEG